VSQYELLAELLPPSSFGLSEEGVSVHRGGTLPTVPPYIVGEGISEEGGTPQEFRSDEEAIDERLHFRGSEAHIRDNSVRIHFEAEEPDIWQTGQELLDKVLQHLSVSRGGVRFSYRVLGIEGEDGKTRTLESITWRVTWFYLDQLRDAIRNLGPYVDLSDARLDAALDYYEHALWLRERTPAPEEIRLEVRHARRMVSSVFLNLWKAVTVIVGDPRERDAQSRYRQLALARDFAKRYRDLTVLRNDADAAHHALNPERVVALAEAQDQAQDTAREVISAYRTFLLAGNQLAAR